MTKILGSLLVAAALAILIGTPIMLARATSTGTTALGGGSCDRAISQAMAIDPLSDTVDVSADDVATCDVIRRWVRVAERPTVFQLEPLAPVNGDGPP
jgi:hypothetical protein